MKCNPYKRYCNPWFWAGLVGVMLAAMGVEPQTLTSWGAVVDALNDLVTNPVALAGTTLAVIGVFINPTTEGTKD